MNRHPKTPDRKGGSPAFQGRMRHYHRKGPGTQTSWDQWIDADRAGRPKRKWGRIVALILGLIALGVLAAALFIEMS